MILGFDPGITGAVAVLTDDGHLLDVHDIPVTAKTSGKGHQVNPGLLADIVRGIVIEEGSSGLTAVVERVGAMPGQGVTGMFGFGRSLGVIEGVVAGVGIPLEFITPQRWKKKFNLTGKDKDASRTLVIEKFPDQSDLFSRKKDVGRADAVLIGLSAVS